MLLHQSIFNCCCTCLLALHFVLHILCSFHVYTQEDTHPPDLSNMLPSSLVLI